MYVYTVHVFACIMNLREMSKPATQSGLCHDVYKCNRPVCCSWGSRFGFTFVENRIPSWKSISTRAQTRGGCCYLGKMLLRLAWSEPSPGSASSSPPGLGSQTGFSGWCGWNTKQTREKFQHCQTYKHPLTYWAYCTIFLQLIMYAHPL